MASGLTNEELRDLCTRLLGTDMDIDVALLAMGEDPNTFDPEIVRIDLEAELCERCCICGAWVVAGGLNQDWECPDCEFDGDEGDI